MPQVEHYVITRITCSDCGGLGVVTDAEGLLTPTCVMCGGKGHFVNETSLLDVLRKLRFTLSGDADERQQWGAFEDLEVWDEDKM